MQHWQIILVFGLVFLIIEIFTPMLFFLNLALSCFLTGILGLFVDDWNILIPVFTVFSAVFLIFLRPILIKARNNDSKTGVEEKYIGKIAKVVERVTKTGGVVSIYDERWNARCVKDEEIEVGTEVKIIKNESLILFVEKNQ